MANRSMQAKVERARSQVVAAGLQEFNKHDYLIAPRMTSEELSRLVAAAPLVHVVKCPAGYKSATWRKRSGVCSRSAWINA